MKKAGTASWLAVLFLGGIIFLGAAARWAAPYAPNDENRTLPYHPPAKIHFRDVQGHWSRPFLYATTPRFDENNRRFYDEDTSRKYPLRFGLCPWLQVDAPARLFLLGTDSRGRDLFSRILYGGRVSLSIGFLGALLAALAGWVIGAISGYYGGRTDAVLMRLAEFFIMVPGFYFLLALRSALPPTLGSRDVYLMTILVLSLIGWGGIARVVRGLVLSLKQSEFIPAAKILGRSDVNILCRHVLPHTVPYLLVLLSVSIPSYIMTESALSVLGLGIQEPDISWGNLLSESLSVAHLYLRPWALFPGLFLCLTAWSFNVLGDTMKQGKGAG
ncbi:MAG TPA: ABC transporter permease [Verrucomicrobiae bacterium]|jgi:peptide/nickel transport system permease protein|nr:ABC transporter permease [Verrucomicrobiae bacterium]